MTFLRRHLAPSLAIALVAGFSGCGGDKLTLPGDGQPTKIEVITGNAQAGIAGSVLPLPLVVKVTDDLGRPVAGQSVGYTVMSGGGRVTPASMLTGPDGRASVMWTLGLNAGDQGVLARAVGGGAPDNLTQSFTAIAVAGSGSLVAAVSGDDQSAPVSSALADPLIVRVSDGNGNPVSGITIQWTVQSGGSIGPETVVTGDDGLATAARVLGPTAGQQTAQASGDGLAGSPVTFVQTALPSNPTALTEVSGNGQSAPAGFEVAGDLVVRLTDDNGNGVGGRAVAWVIPSGGGGAVTPASSTTDPTGLARTRWTLGGSAGTNTLNAVFSGLPPVPFTATASADVPTTLAIASGDNQSAAGGAALANPLAVKVTDANNNPVQNVSVAWTPSGPNGGGTVSSNTSATDAQGIARITRTLGGTPGAYTTTADVPSLAGSPVTFNSTATAGAAAKIVILTPPSATAVNGALFTTQPVVQVQDAAGNNVGSAGRAIAASLLNPPPGASLNGDLSKDTDPNGQAAFTDLSITGPVGNYTIRFRSGALTETTAIVAVTVGPVSASQSAVDATPPSVAAGTNTIITVTARDAGGNAVQGATVSLSSTGSNNNFGALSGPTDASGQATATFNSTSAGPHTITATIDGTLITDKPVVTVGAGDVDATQSTVTAAPPSVAAGALATVTATARDAGGNAVPGATVVLMVSGTNNTINQPSGTTGANGQITGTFSSTTAETKSVTATINGTLITDDATVTVTAGAPSAILSTLTVDQGTITAGGVGSTVTVTARNAGGVRIVGASVVLSATGGGSFTAPAVTDANGVTTSTYTSTGAGDHTISATINGVPINAMATVTVQAGAAALLTFSSQPPALVLSNTVFTVAVSITDAFGNPTDATVGLTLNQDPSGTATLGGTVSLTSTGGVATFSDLTVNQASGLTSDSLTASSSGTNSPTSNSFLVQ